MLGPMGRARTKKQAAPPPAQRPDGRIYRVTLRRRMIEERVVHVRLDAPPSTATLDMIYEIGLDDAAGGDWKETVAEADEHSFVLDEGEEPDLDLTRDPHATGDDA